MIVDICMPRMDGITFVRTIRGQQDNTPVIMLTAMNTFDHKKKGFSSGISFKWSAGRPDGDGV